jgi:hypothetical protein
MSHSTTRAPAGALKQVHRAAVPGVVAAESRFP